MRELALFAGGGGSILGGRLCGWRTVVACEIDEDARNTLFARQRDGILPRFKIWDDVRTFPGLEFSGQIDVISAGWPCQDISAAGPGSGIGGPKSGLWKHVARILGEVQPEFALLENSPFLTSRGLEVVLGDLAALGFNAEWGVLGAHHAGLDHKRERIWILATNTDRERCQELRRSRPVQTQHAPPKRVSRGPALPVVRRTHHGLARRVDRLRALGNGQVPRVAALAWHTLMDLGSAAPAASTGVPGTIGTPSSVNARRSKSGPRAHTGASK